MSTVTGDQEEGMRVGNHSVVVMDIRVSLMEDDTNEVVVLVGKILAASRKMEPGRGCRWAESLTQGQEPKHHHH